MTRTEEVARLVADEIGRDWNDCGEYERMSFKDEAIRRIATREKLARVIHDSWSVESFDPVRDTEDWITADAVLAAFPHLHQ